MSSPSDCFWGGECVFAKYFRSYRNKRARFCGYQCAQKRRLFAKLPCDSFRIWSGFLQQAPYILAQNHIPTYLLGKVADIVETKLGAAFPAVDTAQVLQQTLHYMDEFTTGFMCSNVQETDLAGHAEDTLLYAQRLQIADEYLGRIMQKMAKDDILIVTYDLEMIH